MSPGARPRKGRIKFARRSRWLAVIPGALLVTVLVEGAARLIFPPPAYFHDLPYDPDLGYRAKAGTEAVNFDPAGRFPFRLNELGARGPVPAPGEKPADTRRILFCGDSFLEGWMVREEDLIPFSCRRALREEEGMDVETYSLSCSGHGTVQEWLLLRRHAERIQPDLVCLCFYVGNDISDNSFDLVGRTMVSSGGYLRPFLVETAEGGVELRYLNPRRAFLRRHSRVFQLIEHRLLVAGWISPPSEGDDTTSYDRIKRGGPPYPYYNLFTAVPGARWEAAWRDTELALRTFRDEVDRMGAELVVAVLPHRHQVETNAFSAHFDEFARSSQRPAFDAFVDWNSAEVRLRGLLGRLGIEGISLLEPLRQETLETSSSLFLHDGHLSGHGHRVASRTIARSIASLARGDPPPPLAPLTRPVNVSALALEARSSFDFSQDRYPELLDIGWTTWLPEFSSGESVWVMTTQGGLLVPNRSASLTLRCSVPESADYPVTFLVDGERHEIEGPGIVEVRRELTRSGHSSERLVHLESEEVFPLFRNVKAGLLLHGFSLEIH